MACYTVLQELLIYKYTFLISQVLKRSSPSVTVAILKSVVFFEDDCTNLSKYMLCLDFTDMQMLQLAVRQKH